MTEATTSGDGQQHGGELTPDAARTQLVAVQQDGEFMREYLAGDQRRVAEMRQLFERAYPTPQAGDAQPAEQLPKGAEWLARPSSPAGYDFGPLRGPEPTPQERQFSAEVAQALHDVRLPAAVVAVGVEVIRHAVRDGALPDAEALERSRLVAKAELELRHGDKAGAILSAAQRVYRRIEARDGRIAELLDATGASNSAWLVETLARAWDEKFARSAK